MPTQQELDQLYHGAFAHEERNASGSMRATDSRLAAQYASLIRRALPTLQWKGLKILDFGAGEGDTAIFLSTVGANVTAVESYGFDLCKAKGVRTFRNLQELPAGAKFDGVLMIEVLEHLQNPVQTLRELKGYLKDGGWLFLTTPNNNRKYVLYARQGV